ncbi:MAG: hypothetical protein ACRCZF_23010 [Gemmataceae bacterium]
MNAGPTISFTMVALFAGLAFVMVATAAIILMLSRGRDRRVPDDNDDDDRSDR